MIFRFATPWAFLALLVPLAYWASRKRLRQNGPALPFGTGEFLQGLPKTLRMRCQWLYPACAVIAWIFLTIALARPQKGQEQIRESNEGIAIEMVLDRSGSMRTEMNYGFHRQNRLETVKEVFSQFVLGDKGVGLAGRHNDLIGVIQFAHYPYTACPLTMDHHALAFSLKNVTLIEGDNDENGTAIGDAVAMGVARLAAAEQTLAAQNQKDAGSYHLKSKIIILLTDGQDEGPHTYSIAEAAELAKKHGIKVYSIAILSPQQAPLSPLGPLLSLANYQYDTSEIQAMAQETGGSFLTCDSAKTLAGIYKTIDELERSKIESVRYVTHHEFYQPFLALGFAFSLLAILLRLTLCRRTA